MRTVRAVTGSSSRHAPTGAVRKLLRQIEKGQPGNGGEPGVPSVVERALEQVEGS